MEPKPLPTSKQEAFLDSPLYSTFTLEGREEEELIKFFLGGGTLDAWCPKCQRISVFRISSQLTGHGDQKKTLPYAGLLERLAKGGLEEDLALAQQGLADWAAALDAEDRRRT